MSQTADDVKLEIVALIAASLGREVFGSIGIRVPRLKYFLHDDERYAGVCWPHSGIISMARNLEFSGVRAPFIATLCHELGHAVTRNEDVSDGHGPRWRSVMRRIGLDPLNGGIHHGSPVAKWLDTHRW